MRRLSETPEPRYNLRISSEAWSQLANLDSESYQTVRNTLAMLAEHPPQPPPLRYSDELNQEPVHERRTITEGPCTVSVEVDHDLQVVHVKSIALRLAR